ncbi:MAG TPA: hypothetical protein VGP47_04885, partial [Parachlamydiaceae bacterium]|nr:hypothetical protein [Parachlamydiaceae bacterium]
MHVDFNSLGKMIPIDQLTPAKGKSNISEKGKINLNLIDQDGKIISVAARTKNPLPESGFAYLWNAIKEFFVGKKIVVIKFTPDSK